MMQERVGQAAIALAYSIRLSLETQVQEKKISYEHFVDISQQILKGRTTLHSSIFFHYHLSRFSCGSVLRSSEKLGTVGLQMITKTLKVRQQSVVFPYMLNSNRG